jgi:hypothetical protein
VANIDLRNRISEIAAAGGFDARVEAKWAPDLPKRF